MATGIRRLLVLAILVVLVLPALASACVSNQASNQDGTKLDSHLLGLIEAEKRGEADVFARQGNIKLVDGRVRVTVECAPGQVEAATEAVASVGVVEIVNTRHNSIQAVVPISSLTTLADERSVKSIRLPIRSEPGASS